MASTNPIDAAVASFVDDLAEFSEAYGMGRAGFVRAAVGDGATREAAEACATEVGFGDGDFVSYPGRAWFGEIGGTTVKSEVEGAIRRMFTASMGGGSGGSGGGGASSGATPSPVATFTEFLQTFSRSLHMSRDEFEKKAMLCGASAEAARRCATEVGFGSEAFIPSPGKAFFGMRGFTALRPRVRTYIEKMFGLPATFHDEPDRARRPSSTAAPAAAAAAAAAPVSPVDAMVEDLREFVDNFGITREDFFEIAESHGVPRDVARRFLPGFGFAGRDHVDMPGEVAMCCDRPLCGCDHGL